VNARDNEGNSPLHETFLTDVEEELLKLAANLNARSKDGETPISTTVDPTSPLFWRRSIFFSATQSNSSRRRCDEIGVFALDSAQHPAHRPVLCPWSELTLLANRLSDGPSCSP